MKTASRISETVRKAFIFCGILSSLLYVAMNIFIPMAFNGYDSAAQTVSELSALGVPTRALWVTLGILYTLLIVAFGSAIIWSAPRNSHLRNTGWLILAYGFISLFWPLAPMHQREALAAGQGSLTDTMHIVLAIITVCLMMAAISFGAMSFGKQFRRYSIATILVLIFFGTLTFTNANKLEANLPTPGMGIWERVSIGAYLLWIIVLGILILAAQERNSMVRHKKTVRSKTIVKETNKTFGR